MRLVEYQAPKYRLYPRQEEIVEKAVAALRSGKTNIILDAPTGVGKTFIGTAIRERCARDGIYSAADKELQKQYLGDFPTVPLIQGHENYCGADESWHKSEYQCEDCGADLASHMSGVRHLHVVHGKPLEELRRICEYACHKILAMAAPMVNANPWFLGTSFKGDESFSGRDLIVYDEADAMQQVIDMVFGEKLAISTLEDHGFETDVVEDGDWNDWVREFRKVRDEAAARVSAVREKRDRLLARQKVIGEQISALPKNHRGLTALNIEYRRADRTVSELNRDFDRMSKTAEKFAEACRKVELGPDYVAVRRERLDVTLTYVRPGDPARAGLWEHSGARVFMSGSFCFPFGWAQWMGLDWSTVAYIPVASPFPVENRPVFVQGVANMSRSPQSGLDGFAERGQRLHAMARAIDERRVGNTLVHVRSAAQAEALGELFPGSVIYPNGGKSAAWDEFVSGTDGLLIAQSMQRGMNGTHEKVRTNIVAKVPFPYMGDRLVKSRMRASDSWYTNETASEVTQALGRGVRTDGDWCNNYVLDGAFRPQIQDACPRYIKDAFRS